MSDYITVRVDPVLKRQLVLAAEQTGQSCSGLIRDAVRRQLALRTFETLRERLLPAAERMGYRTDEDIFRNIS